jgi:hypothetical protein
MGHLGRVVIALTALFGFTAVVGMQSAGASQPKSDLAVYESLNQSVNSFGLQFTVPKYTCSATNDAVNGYADSFDPASSAPFAYNGAYVQMACSKTKKAVIYPLLEVEGVYSHATFTVHKGDAMVIAVTCNSSGVDVTLTDQTTSASQSATSSTPADCNGVWMGNIAAASKKGAALPLPKFGSFTFAGAQVNGADYSTFSPTAVNYNEGIGNKIKVGALNLNTWVNTQK